MISKSLVRGALAMAAGTVVLLTAVSCGGESAESLLTSAKSYLAKKDAKTAIIQIKNALQKNPDLPEGRYLLGRALLDSGDAAGAELELRKARALQYSADQVSAALGRSLLMQGQFKKVVEEFGAATLTAAASKADLDTSLGAAHAALGNRDAAEKSIFGALAAVPDFAPAQLAQARLQASKGDIEDALTLTGKLLVAHPDNYEGDRKSVV